MRPGIPVAAALCRRKMLRLACTYVYADRAASLQRPLEDLSELPCACLDRKFFAGNFPAVIAEPARSLEIGEQPLDGVSERSGIALRNQFTIHAVFDHLGNPCEWR